jgi:hypothetical protein
MFGRKKLGMIRDQRGGVEYEAFENTTWHHGSVFRGFLLSVLRIRSVRKISDLQNPRPVDGVV